MKVAIHIPIKSHSERVPGKNFRLVGGKPLCYWLLDRLQDAPAGWDLYIDSESDVVLGGLTDRYPRLIPHRRHPWLAGDGANGNHLLASFAALHPDYAIYAQAFVTAPTLRLATIAAAIDALATDADHDSVVLVTRESGFFWWGGRPVNYDPNRLDGLPRTQDAPVFSETTGLYVVRAEALRRRGCRVGAAPLLREVGRKEAVDLDTAEDFEHLEATGWLD